MGVIVVSLAALVAAFGAFLPGYGIGWVFKTLNIVAPAIEVLIMA